jgi:hypothetical protein
VVEHEDETRAAYDGVVELYASVFADRLETRPFATIKGIGHGIESLGRGPL